MLVFATFIIGDTPFPEFSAVVMLDDVQLGYYDSNVRVFILRGLKSEPEDVTLQEDAGVVFGHVNRGMKYRASHLKQRFNHTGGECLACRETEGVAAYMWVMFPL